MRLTSELREKNRTAFLAVSSIDLMLVLLLLGAWQPRAHRGRLESARNGRHRVPTVEVDHDQEDRNGGQWIATYILNEVQTLKSKWELRTLQRFGD